MALSRPVNRALLLACLGIGAAVAAVLWDALAQPASWVALWVALCAGAIAALSGGNLRVLAVNVVLIALVVFVLERWLEATAGAAGRAAASADTEASPGANNAWRLVDQQGAFRIYQLGERLVQSSPAGFVSRRSVTVQERMLRGSQTIYDVTYRTTPAGLRVTRSPYRDALPADAPVTLFVGGSFTFGQGVEDDETLPSQFEVASRGRRRAENWSTIGAAAHVVLAQLQSGADPGLGSAPVERVVYVGIQHHLERISGRASWSPGYPQYRRTDAGLIRDGSFLPWHIRAAQSPALRLQLAVRKSAVGQTLMERLPRALKIPRTEDAELLVGILEEMQREVRRRWEAPLAVVLWDDFAAEEGAVVEGLRALGIDVVTHQEAFPAFDPATHYLPQYPHPSPKANQELGARLAERWGN